MTPNNILVLKEEYHKLVEFDSKKLRFKPKFSQEELEILKGIQVRETLYRMMTKIKILMKK